MQTMYVKCAQVMGLEDMHRTRFSEGIGISTLYKSLAILEFVKTSITIHYYP